MKSMAVMFVFAITIQTHAFTRWMSEQGLIKFADEPEQ
jgi:hypothetical protein